MVRKMFAEMQPFRKIVVTWRFVTCPRNHFVRSHVSIARNYSKLTIFDLLEQPFRKIIRVDRMKLQ